MQYMYYRKKTKLNVSGSIASKNILVLQGFSGVWYSQTFISSNCPEKAMFQKLKDVLYKIGRRK